MTIPDVEKALLKYEKYEEKINITLKNIDSEKDKNVNVRISELRSSKTFDEALVRNKALINELEIVKGNLRSKAIYSPLEMQWKKICENYKSDISLPVTTWKCISPIYV